MSLSTYVKGYRSPEDPNHQKHLRVLQVCKEAGVSLPEETALYFDHRNPQNLDPDDVLEVKIPVQKVYPYDGAEGYEVVLSEIPQGVHKIRFTNSW